MTFSIVSGTTTFVQRADGVYTPSTAAFGDQLVTSIKLTPGKKNRDGSYSLGVTAATQKLSGEVIDTLRIALSVQMTNAVFGENDIKALFAHITAHLNAAGHINRQLQGEV